MKLVFIALFCIAGLGCAEAGIPRPTEDPGPECTDGFDNDDDGLVDCADEDCMGFGLCEPFELSDASVPDSRTEETPPSVPCFSGRIYLSGSGCVDCYEDVHCTSGSCDLRNNTCL